MIKMCTVFKMAFISLICLVTYVGWLPSSLGQDDKISNLPNSCIDHVHTLNRILMGDVSRIILKRENIDPKIQREVNKQLNIVDEQYDHCLYSKDPVPGTENYYRLSGYLGVFVLKFEISSRVDNEPVRGTLETDYQLLVELVNKILDTEDVK